MLRRFWTIVILGGIFAPCCWSDDFSSEVITPAPWTTGPIFAFSGITAPPGTANFQTFFVSTKTYRPQNLYTQSPQLDLTVGLGKRFDVEVITAYSFNNTEGHSYNSFQDVNGMLTFQAIPAQDKGWIPALRVALMETFPTGNYDRLDPNKLQADLTGEGVYQTSLGAFFTKYYELPSKHWLNTYLTLIYTIPATTHITGYSFYGGSAETNGREKNGGTYFADVAFEYTLTKNWVITNDVTYTYDFNSDYSGFLSTSEDGSFSGANAPSTTLVTIAPGIEYNFNAKLGILVGTSFSVYKKNTNNFVAGIITVNYLID